MAEMSLQTSKQANIATVYQLMEKHKDQISMALPRHMNLDRVVRIALTEFRSNPRLQECDPLSFFAAVIKSSQLGLELGLIGEAYLIPYKVKGRMEATFQPSYRGLRKLAKNSGDVRSIVAHCVYENDEANISLGTENLLVHKPLMVGPRGQLSWVYAVITYKDGSKDFFPMTREEVLHVRDNFSKSYKDWLKQPNWPNGDPKDKPAWVSSEAEMWRKTAIIRACKQVELSPELQQAIEYDTKAEMGLSQDLPLDVFDVDPPTEPEEQVQDKKDELRSKLEARKVGRPKKQKEETPEPQPSKPSMVCPKEGDTVYIDWCRDNCKEQCQEFKETLPEPGSEG